MSDKADDNGKGVPKRTLAVLVAMTAVVALALGIGGTVLWTQVSEPDNESADAGFLRDMRTHHAQAVEMAIHEYKVGDSDEMKIIAYDIATAQQAEIGMMLMKLQQWDVDVTHSNPMEWMERGDGHDHGGDTDAATIGHEMAGMATEEEMDEFLNMTGHEADIRFAELMIAHHEGGVDMAEGAVELAQDEEVVELAERMVIVQKQEIIDMQNLVDRLESQDG
ncbi:DUF305 domain-containing protein [Haloglycomyces albus]|uniref:DUF305 domain-containing protein n=1 Tax=Haloglycomyces albus TaxID=526067 RepID=UPI00046C91C5|nr:DUF305 domain-containing protein [Haloglycomyces albus]